jgi:hypothetical protein
VNINCGPHDGNKAETYLSPRHPEITAIVWLGPRTRAIPVICHHTNSCTKQQKTHKEKRQQRYGISSISRQGLNVLLLLQDEIPIINQICIALGIGELIFNLLSTIHMVKIFLSLKGKKTLQRKMNYYLQRIWDLINCLSKQRCHMVLRYFENRNNK